MVKAFQLAINGLFKVAIGKFAIAIASENIVGVERAGHIQTGDVVTVRSQDYPILSLAELLQTGYEIPTRTGQILLVELENLRFGLWADKVTRLPHHAISRICDAPASLDSRFSCVVLLDEGAMPILDLQRLVDQPEDKPQIHRVPNFNFRNDSPSVVRSNRLVVGGFFEYPKPGGRLVGFGLATGCIEEITETKIVTPVADSDAHLLGLIEWRGKPIPIVDPAVWCGLAARNRESSRAVVIRKYTGDHMAIAIGKDVKSIPVTSSHIERSTWLPVVNDRVAGVYEFSGLTVVLPQFS